MKVAFVASEATPHAKTGGLADVVGTLPHHLQKLGIETTIFMPRYQAIKGERLQTMNITMQQKYPVAILKSDNYRFIDYPPFFEREGLYGTESGDYKDNCERFTLFCKAVTQLVTDADYDIVHCHDWQSALIPLYVRLRSQNIKTVFTIHNLGYQGKFPGSQFPLLGLDRKYFSPEGIEFYGDMNFLKAGIIYSDIVTTVSENYAREIQTPDYGFGLEGVLKEKGDNLKGIINGIDYNQWNPQTDELIYETYDDVKGKQNNKVQLTTECNIDPHRPLIGMVSRIAGQKGFDILIKAFDEIVDTGFNIVVLGFGEEQYYEKLRRFEDVYTGRVSINIKFDNKCAHRIYAGSDFFLMPSRYEPCGLGQLISLKYGTVPIARKTGGLADTITEFQSDTHSGNGFLFTEYSAKALLAAIQRAYAVYKNRDVFTALSKHCMEYNFSWEESAKKYKTLYQSLINP
jgi:starch synthase